MTKNKKTLDTLVEDIYNKLSALGKGEHLDIDEETIEQFGESMKEILNLIQQKLYLLLHLLSSCMDTYLKRQFYFLLSYLDMKLQVNRKKLRYPE